MSKKKTKSTAEQSSKLSGENPVLRDASEKIRVILESANLGIQPFLQFTEFGVFPQVRLVEKPKQETNEINKATDTGEVGAGKE